MNEAKQRFRELAKKYHPDAGGDAKVFAEISNQMDAFNPTAPEHSNAYKGYGGTSYTNVKPDLNSAFQDAFQRMSKEGREYRFNKIHKHSEIPFDHPIHQDLRKALDNCAIYRSQIQELKNIIEVKSQDINHKLTKIFEHKDKIRDQEEEIDSLKSQIEVLSRPQSATSMLDKIRSYFEKQS